eukprot:1942087-Pyramimonas_sp.AAC.2
MPTECALPGRISWIRQMTNRGVVHCVQWCDARDVSADRHAKVCIGRELLLQVMEGKRSFNIKVNMYMPCRGVEATAST